MVAITAVGVFPVTVGGMATTLFPYETVNPHWNETVVLAPLALTVPLSWAVDIPMFEAGSVVTVGAGWGGVVKVIFGP
jgi:hypothetical protein